MANDFTQNPFIIDTESGVANATQYAGRIKVKQIRIKCVGVQPTDQTIVIKDAKDNILWETLVVGTDYIEQSQIERWWQDGFRVHNLADNAGAQKVYVEYM